MKRQFNCSIGAILVILYSLLDGYYNFCRNCGRVISFKENICPYCSEVQNDKSENKEMLFGIEILKKRYAKGEITKEEFKDMKKDLEG